MTAHHGYPRPQLVRGEWASLNGQWEFAFDADARWRHPDDVAWATEITVPFAPETPMSGIHDIGFYRAVWYRRTVQIPAHQPGERLHLHFGAVDTEATVWIDGRYAGGHYGGYTPFTVDVTDCIEGAAFDVTLRAADDPLDLAKPRGKQDWLAEPHAIWYPRTTGIWQTVWLEVIPATRIGSLRWTPSVPDWQIAIDATVDGVRRDDLSLAVTLSCNGKLLADDRYRLTDSEISRKIPLSDPGIDSARNDLYWRPGFPNLIDAEIRLIDADNNVIDRVTSYTAMRSVGTDGDRFTLNERAYYLRFALDQGYWRESGMTAPSDDHLRQDVELALAMGFNGVRKHQKIEDPRFLYWADRLGLLVWEELPSAYRFTGTAVERLVQTWTEAIRRDYSHPCIVTWVPVNESWGFPDLVTSARQRDAINGLYHLTKGLDGTRPVVGNDGWEQGATDLVAIHDYDGSPEHIRERYRTHADLDYTLERERPARRTLLLKDHPYKGQPVLFTEFGGIALTSEDVRKRTWGYTRSYSADVLAERYDRLLETIRTMPIWAGFCYTQLTDTYQEANGLLYADRTPKFDIARMHSANTGQAPVVITADLQAAEQCDPAIVDESVLNLM